MVRQGRVIEEEVKNIGLLTRDQIKEVHSLQKETHESIDEILLRLGYIKTQEVGNIIAEHLGLAFTPIKDLEISTLIINKVPSTVAYRHRIVPVRVENNILFIATDRPFNYLASANIEEFLKSKIEFQLASPEDLTALLERFYSLKEQPIDTIIEDFEAETVVLKKKEVSEEEAPIIKLVSMLIADAFKRRSSDIHIEPLENKFRIRYRIDGILHEVPGPPKHLQSSVISRVKLMAGMDIAEKRLPQDGRIRLTIHQKDIDLRVSTLPAIYGESVVLRILDRSSFLMGLSQLGFLEDEQETFEKIIRSPHGIILDTGPTGSGKTTTLYACLNYINKPDRKLVTIEDPVEYQLNGVNQVQIKPQIGLSFATGLRSILRQAPDVIMVGEIRDYETAQIAIQAALTGHLVISTLHTNDAPGAITRLVDMGVKSYLVASSLQAILAQRLVRMVCPECRIPYIPTKEELANFGIKQDVLKKATFYTGRGCDVCSQTGFKGRIAIFEFLVVTDKVRDLIYKRVSSNIIREEVRKDRMRTLREDGIVKATRGITTLSEVARVTQTDID